MLGTLDVHVRRLNPDTEKKIARIDNLAIRHSRGVVKGYVGRDSPMTVQLAVSSLETKSACLPAAPSHDFSLHE